MTYKFTCLVLFSLSAVTGVEQPRARTWTFDTDTIGNAPGGFEAAVGEWRIVEDPSAPGGKRALAQLAENSRPTFNVILAAGTNYGDVDISVKMKSVTGEIDQGGGLVWRAKDHRNYYIARFNPLEDNYRVYRVVDGRRQQLQSADLGRKPGWHILRVTMRADHIQCYFDGKKHLDVMDETFREAGEIGLWTKADARTHFDDLTASAFRASLVRKS